jgi:hypothetical protein
MRFAIHWGSEIVTSLQYRPLWTTSVSNRAGVACKASLRTCASPMEPAVGFESTTCRLRDGCTDRPCCAGIEPPARLELAAFALQERRSTC